DRVLWAVGLSLALWLMLTPYSHPNDFLLLFPLILALLGPDAARAGKPAVAVALLCVAIPLGNFGSALWPLGLNPAPLTPGIVLAAALYFFRFGVHASPQAFEVGPVAELAILP
ncbi:MAG: hypothetical protein ACREOD_01685, partial [Candidatus Dormibacteria bacterium]